MLARARIARRQGMYEDNVYKIESLTLNTIVFTYAGLYIRYVVRSPTRMERTPKKPPGLSREDIRFLNNKAREILYAYRTGLEYLTELRKQKAMENKAIKKNLQFLEETLDPQLMLDLHGDTEEDTDRSTD